ncbi:MAG: Rpn family recombination-promoting nuclease/putative transposase, partial [Ruminococcus sp.]|nr:Rpn family recombination-promoting nuclease/putative transposase [Ruminococcus sp.]
MHDNFPELLSFKNDYVFKSILTKPESGLIRNSMISAFTGLKIVESTVIENEPAINESVFEKQIRFDVNCKTADGELVNIEMQTHPMPLDTLENGRESLRARSVYYITKLFLDQGNSEYDSMKRTFQIMICGFNVFGDDKFIHHFYFADKETVLGKLLCIIYVELPKIVDKVNTPFSELTDEERWAILIENADKKNFTAKAEEYMDREDFSMAMDMLSSFSR